MSTTTEPRTVIVTVPMAPPTCLSANKRSRRGDRHAIEDATRTLRWSAGWAAIYSVGGKKDDTERPQGPVTIHEHIVWPKGQRLFDPDGLASMCKAALDGIVDAGIIASDSAKHVLSVTASQSKGDDPSGSIIITITETATGGQDG